jgi:hypothetical protein
MTDMLWLLLWVQLNWFRFWLGLQAFLKLKE